MSIEKGKVGHTPGPWTAHYLPQHRMRVTAQNETASICDVALWRVDYEEQTANARLIASAPDLFAALEAVRDACLFVNDEGTLGVTTDPHIHREMFNQITAALARATGSQP